MSGGYTFTDLYGLGVGPSDPVAAQFMDLARQHGVSPDQANVAANVFAQGLADAAKRGQRWSADDLAAAARSVLKDSGIPAETVAALVGHMRPAVTGGRPDADLPDLPELPEEITHDELHRLETWLDKLEDRGVDVAPLFDVGQTVEGVRYLERLNAYSEGRAQMHPGAAPGAEGASTDWRPHVPVLPPGAANDEPEPEPLPAPEPTAAPSPAPTLPAHQQATPSTEAALPSPSTEDSDRNIRRDRLYAKIADPRYHQRDAEGSAFRAEVQREFEAEYGSAPAGSSEAGRGVG